MMTQSSSGPALLLRRLISLVMLASPGAVFGQITPGIIYSGNVTSYTLTGEGAASLPAAEVSNHFAALNSAQWDGSAWGGAWVEVTGPSGTTLVQIVDLCPECPTGSLDLGPVPFQEITGTSDGLFPITWRLVSAPGIPGPVHFYSESSNPYYLKLQAANLVNPVASMKILQGATYVSMTRTSDNHFQFLPGAALMEPFAIRLTDIFGNVVDSSGLTLSGTAVGQNGGGNFPRVGGEDVVIEQPLDTRIVDGGSRDFGYSIDGSATVLDFTIRNTGAAALTGISITKDGGDAANFTITSSPATTLQPGTTTHFSIRFTTASPGLRSAALHVASSSVVPGLASYDVHLTGRGLSSADDTDGDGLNDAAEAKMAVLGFDWQLAQPGLVTSLYAGAGSAGLYTAAQVQALNVDVPLIQRDPGSSSVKLTLGLHKSTDLSKFEPLPFFLPNLSVNPSGELEFKFQETSGAAFFRIEAK